MNYNMNLFDKYVKKQDWIFAKTYSKTAPHEYIVRENLTMDEDIEFEKVVVFIRENGVTEYFYRTPFIYLYHKGYKYWTMGSPLNETKILNRAKT